MATDRFVRPVAVAFDTSTELRYGAPMNIQRAAGRTLTVGELMDGMRGADRHCTITVNGEIAIETVEVWGSEVHLGVSDAAEDKAAFRAVESLIDDIIELAEDRKTTKRELVKAILEMRN
jgi:hypothetical protein